MKPFVDPDLVEPVLAGLVGAIDVDGGPTAEQLAVLDAIARFGCSRADLDVLSLPRLDPTELAAAVVDPDARRRFHELLFTIEQCRHPLTPAQVERSEAYAAALALEGPDLALFRSLVQDGTATAAADFQREFPAL